MKYLPLLLVVVCLATVSAKDKESKLPDPANDKVLVLEPFKVEGKPIIAFAVDIAVYASPETDKITHIFITGVRPDTDAARAGLQRGDEIVKIAGVRVTEMDSRLAPDSALGRVFLNRDPDIPVDFEILVRRAEKFTLRTQRGSLADRLR